MRSTRCAKRRRRGDNLQSGGWQGTELPRNGTCARWVSKKKPRLEISNLGCSLIRCPRWDSTQAGINVAIMRVCLLVWLIVTFIVTHLGDRSGSPWVLRYLACRSGHDGGRSSSRVTPSTWATAMMVFNVGLAGVSLPILPHSIRWYWYLDRPAS